MSTHSTHPLVNDYLRQIRKDSAFLTRAQQQELLNDLRAHIQAALTGNESDAEVREVLAGLGSPEEVLAPYATTKMPKGGRVPLALGIASVIALLAPPYGESRYGITSLVLAVLALMLVLAVLGRASSVGTARNRAHIALALSLISMATVGVIHAVFIPDPSGGVQINAGEIFTKDFVASPNYVVGEKCTADDLRVTLEAYPSDPNNPESALLAIGNRTSSLCSIEGDFSLRVGQADGREVNLFTQKCWALTLQDRCISATLKANANFRNLLDAQVGYATFWITGTLGEGGRICSKATAPQYFRIVANGLDVKAVNAQSVVATCTGAVTAEVRQPLVPN